MLNKMKHLIITILILSGCKAQEHITFVDDFQIPAEVTICYSSQKKAIKRAKKHFVVRDSNCVIYPYDYYIEFVK